MLIALFLQSILILFITCALVQIDRERIVGFIPHKNDGLAQPLSILIIRSYLQRLVGLLNHTDLAPGQGLLLLKSASVHTRRMLFAIDVVALSKDFTVLAVVTAEPGLERVKLPFGTKHVLEVRAHSALDYVSIGIALDELRLSVTRRRE